MTPKPATTSSPLDDPDLSNDVALFDTVRQIATNVQLLMARVDGLTEAIAAMATRPPAAAAAAPAGGASTVGTWELIYITDAYQKTMPKNGGGTWTKNVVKLATGKEMDIARGVPLDPFIAKKGGSIEVLTKPNKNAYPEIHGWK